MAKFLVLQTTTILEQIRWKVEADNLEEAIEKIKNEELDEDAIDEENSLTKDITYEADEVDEFDEF